MDVDGTPAVMCTGWDRTIGRAQLNKFDEPRGALFSTSRFEPATLAITLGALPQAPDRPLRRGGSQDLPSGDPRKLIPQAIHARFFLEQHEV